MTKEEQNEAVLSDLSKRTGLDVDLLRYVQSLGRKGQKEMVEKLSRSLSK
jgi:hypothetical protein